MIDRARANADRLGVCQVNTRDGRKEIVAARMEFFKDRLPTSTIVEALVNGAREVLQSAEASPARRAG